MDLSGLRRSWLVHGWRTTIDSSEEQLKGAGSQVGLIWYTMRVMTKPGLPRQGAGPGRVPGPPPGSKNKDNARPASTVSPPPGGSSSRKRLSRPPLAPVIVLVVIAISAASVVTIFSRNAVLPHLFAAVVGMFGSVLVLGWFRIQLNGRISSGNFSDWGAGLDSSRLVLLLVCSAWFLGSVNLFFSVYELLRP